MKKDDKHTPRFDPSSYEADYAHLWEKERVYATPDIAADANAAKKKKYVLGMFPYPSGAGLHTGHTRIYTGVDVLARYYRMNGYAVLDPMGWDAFGLPAENAAIKAHKNPQDMVPGNIDNFKRQCRMLGYGYDWEREINTTEPRYYAITQWLFIQFFKRGLLYKKEATVFYCPFCKTGLAQEEVQGDGTHERCGNVVEQRTLPQWIFRITAYADSLLEGLNALHWPKGILEMQRNWIGKKEGINITYEVVGSDEKVVCFTTTPVNFGATFIVIAPEHPLVRSDAIPVDQRAAVQAYVAESLRKTEQARLTDEKHKTGVFTGLYARNHLTDEKLPIWVSDFVLMDVGTGAVQGCPGHDKRDFAFAQKFGIPIRRVVVGEDGKTGPIEEAGDVIEKGENGTMIHSGFLDGLPFGEAMEKTMDYFVEEGWGKRVTTYHLRDWIFSRQRYWGEPIPMIYCSSCAKKRVCYKDLHRAPKGELEGEGPVTEGLAGWFPIDEDKLPLKLPYLASYEPSETGESPLSSVKEWYDVECPVCGGQARRETDTMPNWAGSCWYFLAFAEPQILKKIPREMREAFASLDWIPVDRYIGGAEHAVLHLLYARFWMHALHDMGIVTEREPFKGLTNVGMVLAEDGRKMSKSLGNIVNPDDVVDIWGADVLRIYVMFMAPFSQEVAWSDKTLKGAHRFLRRIWQIFNDSDKIAESPEKQDRELARELQSVARKISRDIPDVKFNTSVSALMTFLNMWEASETGLSDELSGDFLKLLAPFAPFLSDYLWRTRLGQKTSIHVSSWPVYEERVSGAELVHIAVQVNGRVRGQLVVKADEKKDDVVSRALDQEKVRKHIGDVAYSVIYVPGRIVNFVPSR